MFFRLNLPAQPGFPSLPPPHQVPSKVADLYPAKVDGDESHSPGPIHDRLCEPRGPLRLLPSTLSRRMFCVSMIRTVFAIESSTAAQGYTVLHPAWANSDVRGGCVDQGMFLPIKYSNVNTCHEIRKFSALDLYKTSFVLLLVSFGLLVGYLSSQTIPNTDLRTRPPLPN